MDSVMMKVCGALLVLGLLLGLAFFLGYQVADKKGTRVNAVAKGDTRVCLDNGAAKDVTIAELQAAAIKNRTAHEALMKLANAALLEQLIQNQAIATDADSRIRAIQEAARDKTCNSLASLPLCPGVTQRLWPAAAPRKGGQ